MNTNEQNNTFTDIEAEAFAEHEAAKVAQKAKEEAEYQVKWAAQMEINKQNRIKENLRQSGHLVKIAMFVNATHISENKLHVATVDAESFKLIIDGVDVSWFYKLDEEWTKSSWHSKRTGKYRFVTGDYGNRTSYPERKDGTFNYAAIAEKLIGEANKKNRQLQADRQRNNNMNEVRDLISEVFPDQERSKYQDAIAPSAVADKPVFFSLKISQAMTVDEARKLAAAVRSCGIKLHYSDK